jgi:hypothetical protein
LQVRFELLRFVFVAFKYQTKGEKQTGEKSNGEVTIFNKLSEKKTLVAGSKLYTKDDVYFITKKELVIPSATTSSNVGQETKTFGKAVVEVTASAVGAEGNLDKDAKLNLADYKEEELSALANNDFTGGYKKIIAIFSEDDKQALEKKIKDELRRKLQTEFASTNARDYLLSETLIVRQQKNSPDYKVGEELESLNLKVIAKVEALYFTREQIEQQITKNQSALRIDLLTLENLKLTKSKNETYYYSAKLAAKSQKLLDEPVLIRKIKGQTFSSAVAILNQEPEVEAVEIKGYPLPFLILPLTDSQIKIENP